MRWIFKILLFPISLILSATTGILKFILNFSGIILNLIAFFIFLGAIAALIYKDTVTFIQGIIIAFLVSPYGLPQIGNWITGILDNVNDAIKSI